MLSVREKDAIVRSVSLRLLCVEKKLSLKIYSLYSLHQSNIMPKGSDEAVVCCVSFHLLCVDKIHQSCFARMPTKVPFHASLSGFKERPFYPKLTWNSYRSTELILIIALPLSVSKLFFITRNFVSKMIRLCPLLGGKS